MADSVVLRGTTVRLIAIAAGVIAGRQIGRMWTSSALPQPRPHADQDIPSCLHKLGLLSTGAAQGFPQGFTSSFTQGGTDGINGMHATEPLPGNGTAAEVSVRLRAVGQLADRLDAGADLSYVVDVAKAIMQSCDNVEQDQR